MPQKKLKQQILHVLLPRLNPYLLFLFGSISQKRERKDSDIDIGFLSDTQLSPYEVFMIAQDLANELNKDVDLIDLSRVSTVMQAEVVKTGEVLYCSDEKRCMEFQIRVLKMYAKLNEERKVVIDSIKKSGTVYGK